MQPPPKRSGFYGQAQEDEESDYEETVVPSKQKASKYKKAITVNPTEGFRYSDIYLASDLCDFAFTIFFLPSFLPFFLSLSV